jgi:tetratricopeptide (TPR) repeat protein
MKKRPKRKDFEILFYEKLLQDRPHFVQALSCLGDAYTRKGFYLEGLEIDKKLAQLKPEDPIVHYNLACSFALLGEGETALQKLKKAVLLGYDDYSYILTDPDLACVRESPKFKDFFRKVESINVSTA